MRFEVTTLQQKNLSELRDIFSAIPRTENSICLQGDFVELGFFTSPHVTQALDYQGHLMKIV